METPPRSRRLTRRLTRHPMIAAAIVLPIAAAGVLALRSPGNPAAREERESPTPEVLPGALDPSEIVTVIPQDGIPAIDEPNFEEARSVDWLADEEPVIAVEVGDDARAYPLQVMTWHEVVNDTVGGEPLVVTFCPLCNTALAFERPEIDGEVTTFGVSGKLIQSNLLMYDRATESIWPQATGLR